MTSYPPIASKLAQDLLLENIDPLITWVTPGGNNFYLSGPLAPYPGYENGVLIDEKSIRGWQAPIHHLTTQGARQDGDTWNDSVYDAMELDFQVEVTGVTPLDTQRTARAYVDSWNPRNLGKMSIFSPDTGEWWAECRQAKPFPDAIDWVRGKKQKLTCTAVCNDAFWKSFDSVGSFKVTYNSASEDFTKDASGPLSGSWTQTYSNSGRGTCAISNGAARWLPSGNLACDVINRHSSVSTTDSQVITVKLTGPEQWDLVDGGYTDIWGRMDTHGNGIRLRIRFGDIQLSRFTGGTSSVAATETLIDWRPIFPSLWNESWTLVCGTNNGPRNYLAQRDGFTIATFVEQGTASLVGASNRGWGWGMHAGAALFGGQDMPAGVASWFAGDNLAVTQSGFIPVTNRGDQPGWVRHLCYGPGTFAFSNGAGNTPTITFGPIEDGQIVLITTMPRLRSVIDLSPTQPTQQLNEFQQLLEDLISFATNNNVPPLLQQFESFFGILPPQGNLYGLLNGRFNTPIPEKPEGLPPMESHIAVSITGGGPNSKIVSALTPYRKYPL